MASRMQQVIQQRLQEIVRQGACRLMECLDALMLRCNIGSRWHLADLRRAAEGIEVLSNTTRGTRKAIAVQ